MANDYLNYRPKHMKGGGYEVYLNAVIHRDEACGVYCRQSQPLSQESNMSVETHQYDQKVMGIHRLRVNIKSLAAEAKIIRQEAKRCGACYVSYLTEHRRGRLREEARCAHLALAYLRGRTYRQVEGKGSKPVDAKRIAAKLIGAVPVPSDVSKWINNS